MTRELQSWIDPAGRMIMKGDSIEFFTLYGRRVATVEGIRVDPHPIFSHSENDYAELDPEVLVRIPPMQVGPPDAFKPVAELRSRLYSVYKCDGQKRSDEQQHVDVQLHVNRIHAWCRARYTLFAGLGI